MTTAELLAVIEREIGARGWAVFASSLRPSLKRMFRGGAVKFIHGARLESRPDFSLVDEHAAQYASARAGDLIKDFAATTPELLRATVERAIKEGWSSARLRDELVDSYAFGDVRAATIARTEVARARAHGVDAGARVASFDQKSWAIDDIACPVCRGNAAAGWIGIDDVFPSGDSLGPAHPNCACGIAYRRSSDASSISAASYFQSPGVST
jgi:hypothetical protein